MLIVCPTPIGNLQDATPRQKDALASADIIACEDTRRTGKLLELFGIARKDGTPRLVSYHEHNEAGRTGELLRALDAGQTVVLTSDAGTPTISDPGYRLVREAAAQGHEVVALPGPVAAMVALSGSGLPTNRFFFEGFLPNKTKARKERLEALRALEVTVVLYESPYRVVELLEDVGAVYGEGHEVCAARELTKMHEEYMRGPVAEVCAELAAREIHGEFVVLLAPWRPNEAEEDIDAQIDAKIAELLEEGMRPRGIKEVVAELFDVRKSELYDRIERVKKGD
ncbi:16S rRNA (cytidine(1402)-2'-O)-methyltransferase [Persicimonas caeni]|uniref:Ribosomal RNA small subunit methyltransferase I n=1 Tax=Persicimonas caeni TaxID=2292766 RepID=A0A4Y6PNR9_PERCE|nr:16S rRNA (cytidine(1402)-2'-O)-methyltransferase [Persicimonas caeni]QDG49968.1 16S rRNA (cytidine(1402)-2'-O)-methyltransferase [Persicimonas caeni]QED31189.1 16S rRNA (cytidine(1402)-2'-O)-methyltransferase [Persicimonas caeni]